MHHQQLFLLLECINLAFAQTFNTPSFTGELDVSGVLRSLKPVSNPEFDFSPSAWFEIRNNSGNYHLGDLNIAWRASDEETWSNTSTAANRSVPIGTLPASGSKILVSDLSGLIPNSVLNLTRTWSVLDSDVALSFNITNISPDPVEIGSLGFPIEFNSIFTNQSAADVLETCSFIDPYIGLDAGYIQVTRLNGTGPNLVLTPLTGTTKFEAWEFLTETYWPLAYQSNSFEGFYAWQVYSQALADTSLEDAEPWNVPTSYSLQSGESQAYGIRISIAPQVYDISDVVSSLDFPTVVGLPGYILPQDAIGSLYINSSTTPSFEVIPEGALQISDIEITPASPWLGYTVTAGTDVFGRVRVQITYEDGMTQTVHYWIAHESLSAPESVGEHISANQWFTNTSDPFYRAPSIISWDRTDSSFVLQDNRVWVAGLSDEGGAGSFVTFAMKQILQPVQNEIALLEEFVNETVWGTLQLSDTGTWEVRKSLFFYEPDAVPGYIYNASIDWDSAWNKDAAYLTNRAYDYVWVSALYWALYKANRVSPGILTMNTAEWYLEQAYQTTARGINATTGYSDAGLMGESFWLSLLQDLRAENMTAEADALETRFHERQEAWAAMADPFGSEQAWDCTGQEGVYFWSQYFNDSATALKTVQSIHGFDPTIPHWGYNGNARRYWDFTTAGQMSLSRIERQIHHYGSALNSLVLLDWFRRSATPSSPESFYDLRVGYGGYCGPLSNIDSTGAMSMAFHAFPQTLAWDNYTGDYGPNFLGHVQGSGSYLVQHPDFGWTTFGANIVNSDNDTVTITPWDTQRRRFFAADIGLYVQFEAGRIGEITWSTSTKNLTIQVGQDGFGSTEVLMFTDVTSSVLGDGQVVIGTQGLETERGGYLVEIPDGGVATIWWQVT